MTHVWRRRKGWWVAAAVVAALVVAVGGAATPALADSPIHVWEALHSQEKSTPGLYTYPTSTPNYTDLNFSATVTLDPGPSGYVYWAHQFTVNGVDGVSGYIGVQRDPRSAGKSTWRFSVWGASDCEVNADPEVDGRCGLPDFTEPGTSAEISSPMVIGRTYLLRVSAIPDRPGWWNGSFIDTSTGKSVSIGNTHLPAGATSISPNAGFVEYLNWNDPNSKCVDQADSAATYGPITGDGGTVHYGKTWTSNTCTYADRHGVGWDGSAYLAAYPKAIPLASQSSNYFGDGRTGTADKAIDGNTDGNFNHGSVTHTGQDLHASWQADLGTTAYVNEITLYNRTDCCSVRLGDIWVCASTTPFPPDFVAGNQADPHSGLRCYRFTSDNPYIGAIHLSDQLSGPARYVEVQLAGTGSLSLAEVQVI